MIASEEKVIGELTENTGIVLSHRGRLDLSKENRMRLSARGVVVYLKTTIFSISKLPVPRRRQSVVPLIADTPTTKRKFLERIG